MQNSRARGRYWKVRTLVLFGLLLLCLMPADRTSAGQDTHRNSPRSWRGSWITSNDVSPVVEAFVHFRKTFELESVPAHFVVYVSADNQFDLHVNGQRVGWGPAIGDPMHWHYETYDLAPFLRDGSNIIAATVWHLGDNAPIRQMSERLGFVLDCDADSTVDVKTGKTWEVEPERGLSTTDIAPAVKASYYVSSPGERFDGTQFDWAWDATADGTGAWKRQSICFRLGLSDGCSDNPKEGDVQYQRSSQAKRRDKFILFDHRDANLCDQFGHVTHRLFSLALRARMYAGR
jgi:hypothetical protein